MIFKRIALIAGFLALSCLMNGCSQRIQDPDPPNLLFVFADQFRKQALGFMGEDPAITPSIDLLADEGVAFTNAVSSCPICTPFRAMLMTGRFPMSTGMVSNCMPGSDLELKEDELCIGDILKAAGYATGYIGKWHLDVPSLNRWSFPSDSASDPWDGWTPPGPRRHGFDFWYAYNCNGKHFDPNYWKDSPSRIDVDQWSVTHETDVAMEFIRQRPAGRPFALFISWNPPHNPYVAPEEYHSLYDGVELDARPNVSPDDLQRGRYRSYLAAVSSCDRQFGRLAELLDQEGLSENTIVVFTSDHGEMMGSHSRYAKSIWLEESIGIPFIIRWKGKIEPSKESMPFACYHFMPTLLGLMGIQVPDQVEGSDYSGLLTGHSRERATSAFIAGYGNPGRLLARGQEPSIWALRADSLHRAGVDWRTVGYRGLRTERYTYVVQRGQGDGVPTKYLYDLREDPYQLHPLVNGSGEENATMQALDHELQGLLDQMNDPFTLK